MEIRIVGQAMQQSAAVPATPEQIVIRPFRPADQLEVRELIIFGLEEHWRVRDPSKNEDLEDIVRAYAGAVFLVACETDRVIGTGALVPKANGVAEIVRMSVAAARRRQGIGRMILQELIGYAAANGVRRVVLETTATWDGVVRFYLAHGFRMTRHAGGDVWFALDLAGNDRSIISGIGVS